MLLSSLQVALTAGKQKSQFRFGVIGVPEVAGQPVRVRQEAEGVETLS
jgi:hypothetical protein